MSEVILEDRLVNLDLVDYFVHNPDNNTVTIHYSNGLIDYIRFPTHDSFINAISLLNKYYD